MMRLMPGFHRAIAMVTLLIAFALWKRGIKHKSWELLTEDYEMRAF